MKRFTRILSLLVTVLALATAQTLQADDSCVRSDEALTLIRAVDDVFYADSRESVARMEIKKGRRTRTIRMKSWVKGTDKAFTEVLGPARDKGTKFLKLADEMWIYAPDADKILKIAGHMMRKGMLGSDFSYEDAMEDSKLEDLYSLCWLNEKDPDFPEAVIIELTAKVKKVSYFKRRLIVDPETKKLHKEERFARSGKKLKVMTVESYMDVAGSPGKIYPERITIRDLLRNDSETVMITESIGLNTGINDNKFTRQSLRR